MQRTVPGTVQNKDEWNSSPAFKGFIDTHLHNTYTHKLYANYYFALDYVPLVYIWCWYHEEKIWSIKSKDAVTPQWTAIKSLVKSLFST